jgi:hypothetical protein
MDRIKASLANRTWSVLRAGIHDLLTPPPRNVSGLDLLRTLVILLVVSAHYHGHFVGARGDLGIARFPLFFFGCTGVDLFFVRPDPSMTA